MKRYLALVGVTLLGGCASDLATDPNGSGAEEYLGVNRSEIRNGSENMAGDVFAQYVVRHAPWNPFDNDFVTCSGTAIAQKWSLTAAHCIHPDYQSHTVYPSPGTTGGMLATLAIRHPNAPPFGVVANGFVDVALVKLNGSNTFPTWKGWDSKSVAIGMSLACYGYGWKTEWPFTGKDVLRKATLYVFENWGVPSDNRRYKIHPNATHIQLEGDSGGPCFDLSTGRQTGVQSTITRASPSGPTIEAEQTKMSRIEAWITTTIAANP